MEDVANASVRADFYYTLTEILSGFALATVVGISLGAVIALNPLVDKTLTPLIVAIQTIPKVAVAPVLIIWFGFGIESKIIIVALIDFFPILVNAVTGFRSSDPRQILLMKVLKASPWQIFLKVRVFNAIPYLMAGMYIAIVLSVIGAVIGEFLGSAHGLGSQIVQRQGSMDVVGVF
jgi:NitT/TauT family transport system permease protein